VDLALLGPPVASGAQNNVEGRSTGPDGRQGATPEAVDGGN
jgi:hypothetical protein